jgi:hypothetical protein
MVRKAGKEERKNKERNEERKRGKPFKRGSVILLGIEFCIQVTVTN